MPKPHLRIKRETIRATLSQYMNFIELQIPPKVVLDLFEARTVGTGMTRTIPGGATLKVGGTKADSSDPLPLVPVILTLPPGVSVHALSSWLCDALKFANVRHIRINGVESEVTDEGLSKAIAESIANDRNFIAPDNAAPVKPLVSEAMLATAIPEEQVVSSKAAIVCMRVTPDVDLEQYVQGSVIQRCSLCHSDVLVAPSTQMILAHGENQIVCIECWTQAQPPEISAEERAAKLRQLEICKQGGEQAYDDLYEKAHSSSDATAYYSDAKEFFYTAIGVARELGLEQEVENLEARLAHIKAVFRTQFS